MRLIFSIALFICVQMQFCAQEKQYVKATFGSTHVISTQTPEVVKPGAFMLVIQHRFGFTDVDDRPMYDFLGMDKSSNIRFGFDFAITKRFTLGVGRTKYNKNYDLAGKYLLLKQTKSNSMPFSLALYGNAVYRTAEFPTVSISDVDEHGNPFTYNDKHRWTYYGEIIVARKWNRWLSTQVNPCVSHRNLVAATDQNATFAIPIAARFKTGLFNSILLEYAITNHDQSDRKQTLSAGYEIKTASHEFQIYIASNPKILGAFSYNQRKNSNPLEGKFYLGFTLNRRFYFNE